MKAVALHSERGHLTGQGKGPSDSQIHTTLRLSTDGKARHGALPLEMAVVAGFSAYSLRTLLAESKQARREASLLLVTTLCSLIAQYSDCVSQTRHQWASHHHKAITAGKQYYSYKAGFSPREIERLVRLRRERAGNPLDLAPTDLRRLEFVRWLVATGRLTDSIH